MIAVGLLAFVIGIRSGNMLWIFAGIAVWILSSFIIILYLKTRKTKYRLTRVRLEVVDCSDSLRVSERSAEWQYYITSEIRSRSMLEQAFGIGTISITFRTRGHDDEFVLRNIKAVQGINRSIHELGEQHRMTEQHIEHFVTNQ